MGILRGIIMTDTDHKEPTRWAKTLLEASRIVGESESTLKRYKRRAGWPAFDAERGYDCTAIIDYIIKAREGETKGRNKKGRRLEDKHRIETEILRIKRDRLLGSLISLDEHTRALREYAYIVNGAMSKYIDTVSALTQDAKLVTELERVIDEVKTYITDKVHTLDDKQDEITAYLKRGK
jgi:hypothetical protein